MRVKYGEGKECWTSNFCTTHGLEVWKTIRAGWDSLYRFVGYKVGEGLSMMLGMAYVDDRNLLSK